MSLDYSLSDERGLPRTRRAAISGRRATLRDSKGSMWGIGNKPQYI